MKFCDEKIQKHLLSGGKIRKVFDNGRWTHRPIMMDGESLVFADNGDDYNITRTDLTVDNWEISEPEYDWDKIIKDKILCQFWDENEDADEPRVGYLTRMTAEGFYMNGWEFCWKYCKPFNPAEFNIAKDLKDYEK